MKTTKPLWLLLTFLLTAPITAEIYKHTDEYGNVTYSDEPATPTTKELDLQPLNTTPAITPEPAKKTIAETEQKNKALPALTLRFASPSDNYRAGPAEKVLTVILLANRNLDDNFAFQLLIDNKPFGAPSKTNNFNVPLRRSLQGKRILTANILDKAGKVIASATPRTIFVIRPSSRHAPK